MKAFTQDHVEANRTSMFDKAFRRVSKRLEELSETVSDQMRDDAAKIFVSMRRDYTAALFGSSSLPHSMMSEAEIETRDRTKEMLKNCKADVEEILNAMKS